LTTHRSSLVSETNLSDSRLVLHCIYTVYIHENHNLINNRKRATETHNKQTETKWPDLRQTRTKHTL